MYTTQLEAIEDIVGHYMDFIRDEVGDEVSLQGIFNIAHAWLTAYAEEHLLESCASARLDAETVALEKYLSKGD